jgi:hypothetical protein
MNQYIITLLLPSGDTDKIHVPADNHQGAIDVVTSKLPEAKIIEIELSIDGSS